jgi:hypothetical protein
VDSLSTGRMSSSPVTDNNSWDFVKWVLLVIVTNN